MEPVKLSALSRYRSQLMGVAMLVVMLFHVGISRHDTFWFCVNRCGNIGVDIFLFLSGIGLWYAWTKKRSSLAHFYRRRLVRIYPAWLLFASLHYVPLCLEGRQTVAETVGNILIGWRLWSGVLDEFWFIPTILAFYLVAPFYMMLIQRRPVWRWLPVAAMLLCVLIQYWPPLHGQLNHLEILFSRVPIFLLGIDAGQWVKDDRQLPADGLWLLLLVFVMSAGVCINFEDGLRGRFPLFMERMVYIPLSLSMMLLLCRLFDHTPSFVLRSLAFVGTVSLELYLVHVNFVLKNLRPYDWGFWLTALAMIAISLLLAWFVHRLIDILLRVLGENPSGSAREPIGFRTGTHRVPTRNPQPNRPDGLPVVIASDFDGTLTTRDTLLSFIRYARGNAAFAWGFLLHVPLLVLMKLHLYDNGRSKERVFSYFFRGWKADQFNAVCAQFAATHRHLLRPQGLETLRQARADGARVIIVSASIDNWVQPFFPDAEVAGTQIEIVDGRLTGRFLTPNCYGAEKVNRIRQLLPDRQHYYLVAYGDSRGDRELLAEADEAYYKPFRNHD